MTKSQTATIIQAFVSGAKAGQNVSALACLINLQGEREFMREVMAVTGFRDLLAAALPPDQRKMGFLCN